MGARINPQWFDQPSNCGYRCGYEYVTQALGIGIAVNGPVYRGFCECGCFDTGWLISQSDVSNQVMNHATSPRWGLLAYSFSLREARWAWQAADLASTERTLLSSLPAPDAQLVVKAYDTLVAFAVSENGGYAWRSGNNERKIAKDAVKACNQYGKSRLLVLFNTVSEVDPGYM